MMSSCGKYALKASAPYCGLCRGSHRTAFSRSTCARMLLGCLFLRKNTKFTKIPVKNPLNKPPGMLIRQLQKQHPVILPETRWRFIYALFGEIEKLLL
jgi:hypothetical protein